MSVKLDENLIDMGTFGQILELDDDPEERDFESFSGGIVASFFTQAESTFTDMEEGLKTRDLESLYRLGHFLKGSSATLGLVKIKDACEKIQNLGAGKDESGIKELNDPDYALNTIRSTLEKMKQDYAEVAGILKKFYKET